MDVISNTVRYVRFIPDCSRRLHLRSLMLHVMSTTVEQASERSAAEVNEEIRALWRRSGGTLSVEQREVLGDHLRLSFAVIAAVLAVVAIIYSGYAASRS